MQNQIFLKQPETSMRLAWYAGNAQFDNGQKCLSIHIDFVAGIRFAYPSIDGVRSVYDTQLNDRGVGHAPN